MARLRRRRRRVQWLPTLGSQFAGQQRASHRWQDLVVLYTGDPNIVVEPITWDRPKDLDAAATTASLADIVGSSFLLHRVVGRLDAWLEQVDTATISRVVVGFGLFVARADNTNPDIPDGTADMYDPTSGLNIMEPWAFRRTWVLNNIESAAILNGDHPATCITDYTDVMSGGFVDARSKRRVSDDDRLWTVWAARALPTDPGVALTLHTVHDLRIVGTRMNSKGHSSF